MGGAGGGGPPLPPLPPPLPPPPTGLPAYSAAAAISADVELLEEAAATAAAAAAAAAAEDEEGAFRLAAPLTGGNALGVVANVETVAVMAAEGSILISEVGMSRGCGCGGEPLDSGLCSLRRSFQWKGSFGDRSILCHNLTRTDTNGDLVTHDLKLQNEASSIQQFSYVYLV